MCEIFCCCKLESAGEIIGWLGIIFYGSDVVSFSVSKDKASASGLFCSNGAFSQGPFDLFCKYPPFFLFSKLLPFIGLLLNILLIRGIVIRNHNFILSTFIFEALVTFLLVISSLFNGEEEIIILGLLITVISGSLLIILFKLYSKIKSDNEQQISSIPTNV